jgi:hypothetical protein
MAMNASSETISSSMSDLELYTLWHKTQGILQTYKQKESELRTEIVRRSFDTAPTGTTNISLPKGFVLKCVKKVNYNVDQKNIKVALAAIAKLGNEGEFIAGRLIKWKAELSLTEYKQIPDSVKKIIDGAITIVPAMPTLEIVEPKKK